MNTTGLRELYREVFEMGPQNAAGWIVIGGLWPLSCLYRMVISVRNLVFELGLRKVYRASVPVISVGNLTAGGTGKTPMVDALVKRLLKRGVPCAIVSRGYGGSFRGEVGQVNPADGQFMSADECGDEPFLLARRNPGVPVFVSRRRALGVAAAERGGARVIVLDDGFQHRVVHRDLDVVLLDSRKPFGNGRLLPAGPLREPLSALRRCHLVVMTRSEAVGTVALPLSVPVMHSRHAVAGQLVALDGGCVGWDDLKGKKCLAFAGIARPDEFFKTLAARGVNLCGTMSLSDHQEYDAELLNRLGDACHSCDVLLTTEKDGVKLNADDIPVPCYQVAIDLAFEDASPLDRMLDELIERNDNAVGQGTP